MPSGTEGFDLIETNPSDEVERWIEVKAMTRKSPQEGACRSLAQVNTRARA